MRERIQLPMTELEERLKLCLEARPDIRSRILTGQELADYTAWMAREYGPRLSPETREAMIAKLRMERAVLLLMRQNVTAEEIAAATGYATVSSFYRGFTRYYHCTPLEYQKSMGLEG